ncbi:hypothetical protein FH972_014492 [Carpinus fangiana]|uniref:B box-type domain-containing protein n=1 Tax=Carpinus fangiana TaxID=176857 RepID=A0A5N6RAW8_9ROSI|nr:hypothetical protein FH972_014492 [Carpinus fangiana]
MKKCELCKLQARAYCESDQASLCWDCDAKVHGANFLVARHSRTLLCHACQSQTPWKASGAKLGHTVSVCERCVGNKEEVRESQGGNDEDEDEGDEDDNDVDDVVDDDDDDDSGEEEEEEEEEEGDNQVVPWSTTTPPPAASCSSSEEEPVRVSSLKRMRQNGSDLRSPQKDDLGRSSGGAALTAQADDWEATSTDSSRPWKNQRTEPARPVQLDDGSASSSAIITLRRFGGRDLCEPREGSKSP